MKKCVMLIVPALFFGCANYRPVVDTVGVDMRRYEADLRDCQNYAQQVNPAEHAAVGAVGGVILGAVLGAMLGNRHSAGQVAGAYGVIGAAGGGAEGAAAQRNIINNCMMGRGYRVLY